LRQGPKIKAAGRVEALKAENEGRRLIGYYAKDQADRERPARLLQYIYAYYLFSVYTVNNMYFGDDDLGSVFVKYALLVCKHRYEFKVGLTFVLMCYLGLAE